MHKVIVRLVPVIFLLVVLAGATADAQESIQRKVDSLFVIASSGSILYEDLREPAMDSIAALGVEAVPHLIDKFTTRSARDRWTIIWILQRIGTPAIPDLVEALKSPDGLVVQRVCWALGDVGDSSAVEPLVAVSDVARWQVRDQAVGALGKIGDQRAEEAVIRALSDSIGQVRKAAAVAAGRLLLRGYEDRLVHMLGDDFYGARMAAVSTLLQLDTSAVLRAVVDSVRSGNHLVGHLGCYLLGRFATEEVVDTLYILTESEDPDLRAHAAVALFAADPEDLCQYRQEILDRETDRFVRLKMESALVSNQHVDE